jgi:cobalt-zinc-cadmium efflux system outer membrane protein
MFRTIRTRRFRVLAQASLFCAGLAWSTRARAERPISRLTASDAVRLALSNNPDARATDQDVASARGAVTQARLLPNPSVFVSALDTEIQPAQAPIPNQFGVTWTIPIGGKRAASIAAARAGLGAAKASRLASRRRLALDVESAFVTVLLDRSLLEFAKDDQRTFRESVEINEIRYKDGKISYGEVLKLRIQARQVDDSVRQYEQAVLDDRLELQRLIGGDVLAPSFRCVGSLEPPNLPRDLDAATLTRRALGRRPDYQALASELESARSSLTLARRQPIPDLGVLADYNRIPGSAGTYDLQLTATVPLFDRNQGNIATARAGYEKARLGIRSLREQIRADAARAIKEWHTSQERLQAYSGDFVKAAKESLDISRHSYEEGRGTLLDYLDAESSYRDVERAYRSAEAEAVIAAANIHFVSGETP